MPHGGARKGAGRKKGSATAKTREIADRAASEGVTPLEVMLDVMRFHYRLAKSEIERGAVGEAMSPKVISDALVLAKDAAKDAAPYIHPRLSTIDMKAEHSVSDPLAELIARIATEGRSVHDDPL